MDPATIISVARTVIKYGTQVFDYVRDDQNAKLGLNKPVRIVIDGPGIGIGNYTAPDGVFSMRSPTLNSIEFEFLPFPPDAQSIWNGPDGIPNDWAGGSLPASLPHDFICYYRSQIAAELARTEDEIWVWASGILSSAWSYYGGDNPRTAGESWLAYYITRYSRRPYEWIKRRLGFACIIIAALVSTGCTGCLDPLPNWHVTHADPVISIESGVTTTNTPPATLAP